MFFAGYLRVCLDRLDNQAGVDNVSEQKKLEATKKAVKRAESQKSASKIEKDTADRSSAGLGDRRAAGVAVSGAGVARTVGRSSKTDY